MGGADLPDGSLARGAAAITIATAISRVTGFVRVVVVAAAMGTTFLANTYQTANTAPNLIFELMAAGVLTSVLVPTFVGYLTRGEREQGWEAANALTSVALVALVLLSLLLGLLADPVMRLLTLGVQDPELRRAEVELGATLLRLFSPQIIFYGAGMILTAALNAHRRFALPAVAPIANNVVVIAVYLAYAAMRGGEPPSVSGISGAETFLLGAGTTAGVIAMTAILFPALRGLGWRLRFVWRPSHPAVRRGARLGVWALGYAGGYQAGLIVVLVLANRIEGGVAAYQWAFTFFYLPYALLAVPIFAVLFTAMSEHASREDTQGLSDRLQDGLAMMSTVLIPVAVALLILSDEIARVTLAYGAMTPAGARLVGRVLSAFAIGLPTYSMFLIFTRAFYAVGNARVPTLVNGAAVLLASVVGAFLFLMAPAGWEVAGLAAGHSLGFALGGWWLSARFRSEVTISPSKQVIAATSRATIAGVAAATVMVLLAALLSSPGVAGSATTIAVAGGGGAVAYLAVLKALRSPELERVTAILRPSR